MSQESNLLDTIKLGYIKLGQQSDTEHNVDTQIKATLFCLICDFKDRFLSC